MHCPLRALQVAICVLFYLLEVRRQPQKYVLVIVTKIGIFYIKQTETLWYRYALSKEILTVEDY